MGVSVGSSIYNAPSIYESGAGGGGSDSTIGGREYKTVTIGGVTWLAENLDYKFSGCGIGGSGMPTTPNAWYYNDDEATYGIDGVRNCGLLYNWYAAKLLNDNRSNLIPGWHVPTDDEWSALINSVGGFLVAGTRLKAANVDWAPSWGGTDEYGFKVLPTGYRFSASFYDVGSFTNLWASTEYSAPFAYDCAFDTSTNATLSYHNKENGYPIRLVKD